MLDFIRELDFSPIGKALDFAAVTAFLAAMIGWLPSIAAALSIVWYSIKLYDSYDRGAIRHWLDKRKSKPLELPLSSDQ